ncbi:MAG: YraN family protein [Candidatus Moranbacteria bacterium]|nr:YraN family protein [Candidatus Moranbacteria bacterium]
MAQNKPKNLKIGVYGEEIACRFLQKKGYKILERNFSNTRGVRLGEIDIVACFRERIIFVEVKTRRFLGDMTVLPEANINKQKLHKLSKIAQVYLKQKRLENKPYQFDAVSVLYNETEKKAFVKHIESIFI